MQASMHSRAEEEPKHTKAVATCIVLAVLIGGQQQNLLGRKKFNQSQTMARTLHRYFIFEVYSNGNGHRFHSRPMPTNTSSLLQKVAASMATNRSGPQCRSEI
jgi:hypothetical protein